MSDAQTVRPFSLLLGLLFAGSSLALADTDTSLPDLSWLPLPDKPLSWEPMDDKIRAGVSQLVVVASDKDARDGISGTYDEETPGFLAGMTEGSNMGTMTTQMGGVNVSMPIPILTLPGAVYGGVKGSFERRAQEFRDGLAEELAEADSHPLSNHGLSLGVHYNLSQLSSLDLKILAPGKPIPETADAVLYVGFDEVSIVLEDKDAVLKVAARAELRRTSDNAVLYKRVLQYIDRDALVNWTKDGHALWRDFSNYAAHYLARELAGETFGRTAVSHSLLPAETRSVKQVKKDERQYRARSASAELAWDFIVEDETRSVEVFFDVEIYDSKRLVYAERQLTEPRFELANAELDCASYRWSVRPVFQSDGEITYGSWMRLVAEEDLATLKNGLIGRDASAAPAYTQDFPSLEMLCRG